MSPTNDKLINKFPATRCGPHTYLIFLVFAVVHTPSPPVYHAPAPAYKPPSPHVTSYKEPAKPYAFEYGVHDEYSGANFNQAETSDAHAVTGSYSVALPDGRTQTVNYKADGYGYVADVTYQGQAHYPELKPQTYSKPAAPVYHG